VLLTFRNYICFHLQGRSYHNGEPSCIRLLFQDNHRGKGEDWLSGTDRHGNWTKKLSNSLYLGHGVHQKSSATSFNLFLFFSKIKLSFFGFVLKYFNFATFSTAKIQNQCNSNPAIRNVMLWWLGKHRAGIWLAAYLYWSAMSRSFWENYEL
jgi:hypothetical protein